MAKRSKPSLSSKKKSASRSEGTEEVVIKGSFEETLLAELNKNDIETPAQLLGVDGAIDIRGVISSQSPSIDLALGRGGYALGRTIMIHGFEGCIAKGTLVAINRAKKGNSVPIEHVVKMFNGGTSSGKKWDLTIPTFVRCMQPDSSVRLSKLKGAFESGVKNVFEIKTRSGKQIAATRDHLFYSNNGWVRLDSLSVGCRIAVEDGRPSGGNVSKKSRKKQKDVFCGLGNHPFANARGVALHRLVVEADINGMELESFISRIRCNRLDGLTFLDPLLFVVHHIDGNHSNNKKDNLKILSPNAHRQIHADEWANHVLVSVWMDEIVSIKEVGRRITYDLSVDTDGPNGHQNFSANGIIVHNSGKSTLALHAVAEAQRVGGMAVYIDSEYKLDPRYAEAIGVDTKRLVIVQPRYLESAFAKIETMIRIASRYREDGVIAPIAIVLDSINATKSKAVMDGSWEDRHVSPESLAWSTYFPKLIPLIWRENVVLILISQIRENVNVMFGKKDKTAGGNAPRFYASVLMGIERKAQIKGTNGPVGNETTAYIVKNSYSPPYRLARFRIIYGKGIDYEDSLVEACIESEIIKGQGSWLSVPLIVDPSGNPIKAQGRDAMANRLRDEQSLSKRLSQLLKTPAGDRKVVRQKQAKRSG